MFISLIIGSALCAVFILLFLSADSNMAERLRSTLVSNELETVENLDIELKLLVSKSMKRSVSVAPKSPTRY